MFDSLRKRIGGWFGAGKEEPEEKAEEKKESEKNEGKEKKKTEKGIGKGEEKKVEEKTDGKKTQKQKKEKKREFKKVEKRREKKVEIVEKSEEERKEKKEKDRGVEKEKEEKEEDKGEKSSWFSSWFKKKDKDKQEKKEEREEGTIKRSEEEGKREEKERKGKEIEDEEVGEKTKEEEKVEIEVKEEIEIEDRERIEKVEVEIEKEIKIEDEGEVEGEEIGKEELKEEIEEESGFFTRLKKKLLANELKKEEFEEIFLELEIILLENNVALEVVDKIKENLGKSLIGVGVKRNEVEDKIKDSLREAILSVLMDGEDMINKIKESKDIPYIILFFGINGTGKTTTIGKVAYKLKEKGISCVLAAGDTFRAASIEQLEKHAEKVGVSIVKSEYNSDPASVGFEAISYAKKNKIKVVLIDTAGRMYTKTNLMKEMEKIVKVTRPNLKIFVGESITGNDATEQAKMFNETAGIDGIILTKADVDEKSGAILSISYVTGKPIFYLGIGQEYDDLQVFKKEDVLKGLGME